MCVSVCVFALVGQAASIYAPKGSAVGSEGKKWDGGGQKEAKSTKSVERRSRQRQRLRAPAATTTINWQSVHWKNNCTDITHTHTQTNTWIKRDVTLLSLKLSQKQYGRAAVASVLVLPCSKLSRSLTTERERESLRSLARSLSITKSQFCYLNVYACVYLLYSVSY